MSINENVIVVDCPLYIESQPVHFEQIAELVNSLSEPMDAMIDVSCIDLLEVDLVGFVRLVWELHRQTLNRKLVRRIYFRGVPSGLMSVVLPVLPSFVRKIICVI